MQLDTGAPDFDIWITGRIIRKFSPAVDVNTMRGSIALVYSRPDTPYAVILYSILTRPNELRFVRPIDLHVKNQSDIKMWCEMLKDPIDNIKTAVELLSL